MNDVKLDGRLVKDPRITEKVTTLTIAVKKTNGVDYIPLVAFSKQKEVLDAYVKGQEITVKGRLQSGSYEKDGITIYTLDVVVTEVWI